jgi:DNA-directed RNA polymerase specialized sigma24 family protein
MRALRHHNKLAEPRDTRMWLIRITWNLALDRKRRVKVRREADNFEEVARTLTTGGLSRMRRLPVPSDMPEFLTSSILCQIKSVKFFYWPP